MRSSSGTDRLPRRTKTASSEFVRTGRRSSVYQVRPLFRDVPAVGRTTVHTVFELPLGGAELVGASGERFPVTTLPQQDAGVGISSKCSDVSVLLDKGSVRHGEVWALRTEAPEPIAGQAEEERFLHVTFGAG